MFLSVFRYTSKDEELRYARIVGIEQGVAMGVGEYDVLITPEILRTLVWA